MLTNVGCKGITLLSFISAVVRSLVMIYYETELKRAQKTNINIVKSASYFCSYSTIYKLHMLCKYTNLRH